MHAVNTLDGMMRRKGKETADILTGNKKITLNTERSANPVSFSVRQQINYLLTATFASAEAYVSLCDCCDKNALS